MSSPFPDRFTEEELSDLRRAVDTQRLLAVGVLAKVKWGLLLGHIDALLGFPPAAEAMSLPHYVEG